MTRIVRAVVLSAAFLAFTKSHGQSKPNIDSFFKVLVEELPPVQRTDVSQLFQESNEPDREFIVAMLAMPRSSKKELIANIDSNYAAIDALKAEYNRLVPKGYIVYIEFEGPDRLRTHGEQITLKIDKTNAAMDRYQQEWHLAPNSTKLKEMARSLGWTQETLERIKTLLAAAHCISVQNDERKGEGTTIGYARSGLGLYSYVLFDKELDAGERSRYDDRCSFIFYKKNIVLQYGGGAVGSQCFPDPD